MRCQLDRSEKCLDFLKIVSLSSTRILGTHTRKTNCIFKRLEKILNFNTPFSKLEFLIKIFFFLYIPHFGEETLIRSKRYFQSYSQLRRVPSFWKQRHKRISKILCYWKPLFAASMNTIFNISQSLKVFQLRRRHASRPNGKLLLVFPNDTVFMLCILQLI